MKYEYIGIGTIKHIKNQNEYIRELEEENRLLKQKLDSRKLTKNQINVVFLIQAKRFIKSEQVKCREEAEKTNIYEIKKRLKIKEEVYADLLGKMDLIPFNPRMMR